MKVRKLFWSSITIILLSSIYVKGCSDKGICLLEALKEMKECQKSVLASLLKPLLAAKIEKKEGHCKCGACAPPPPPPTLVLMPAGPPPGCLPPPPPPMVLPLPPPALPSLPPIVFSAPPPLPQPLCLPQPQMIFPAPPSPIVFSAPPPPMMLPPPPPAPMFLPPPPSPLCLPPPAPAPLVISLVPPAPPPCSCCPPPPPGLPMTAFMVPPPVPVTLEPKPIELPKYRVSFIKDVSSYGLTVTFSCNTSPLDYKNDNRFYGILYLPHSNNNLKELRGKHFSQWYKWVIVNEIPQFIHNARYDADVVLIRAEKNENNNNLNESVIAHEQYFYDDVYIHPRDGMSTHAWAHWTPTGLQITHGRERILRRLNLKQYPLRIATPIGQYSEEWYNGSFKDYLLDVTMPEHDTGVRCAYAASVLLSEALNATDVLLPTELWSTEIHNGSMLLMLSYGSADLGGGVLRILPYRITRLDYALPIWPFRVGFTYLSERESNSNMFVVPFTAAVWWTCFAFVLLMTLAQRVTAMKPVEKEGAYMAVLATYLQQDASAVPEGASGRWTFVVVSVFSMLIHAYYTSAIVSDLMSTGRSGPDSLRALADSRYGIASEDYDYMKYLMFDVETNWDELEYLKNKKLTSRFYVDMERGVELIRKGNTAYHTEYNQLYPYLNKFTDDQLCKLQYVDTIPESVTWVTTTKRGQWFDYLRSKGGWLTEVGLAKRLVSNLRLRPPPCRAALLAERVKFGDIAPLLALSVLGTALSLFILCIEVIFAKLKRI